ncbi:MAG: hypothetical protein OEU93_09070 [Rubrivivax sp.]|nr:hypothetical protein [Rubrivivax sp.]
MIDNLTGNNVPRAANLQAVIARIVGCCRPAVLSPVNSRARCTRQGNTAEHVFEETRFLLEMLRLQEHALRPDHTVVDRHGRDGHASRLHRGRNRQAVGADEQSIGPLGLDGHGGAPDRVLEIPVGGNDTDELCLRIELPAGGAGLARLQHDLITRHHVGTQGRLVVAGLPV